MLLFALALAPGIAIMFFIYSKDSYDREPYHALVKSFLLGMLSTLPAIALQLAGSTVLKNFVEENSIIWFAILAFIIVGISEELCKYLMAKWYAYPKKYFNEPFDGIIYCVMVAMGFATLENIGYVYQHGIGTAFVRMFISVPAHGAFGVIMGYHLGLAKFMPQQKNTHLLKAILLPALLHGTFDFFLMLQQNKNVTDYVSESLLFMAALIAFFFAIRLSTKSIRLHREISKAHFGTDDNNI